MQTIVELVTKIITYIEDLYNRKYGIRALYTALFLIPSISLLWLYRIETVENAKLEAKIERLEKSEKDCVERSAEIKQRVQKEVLEELKDIYKTFKEFRTDVLQENTQTVRKLKQVENELEHIQTK